MTTYFMSVEVQYSLVTHYCDTTHSIYRETHRMKHMSLLSIVNTISTIYNSEASRERKFKMCEVSCYSSSNDTKMTASEKYTTITWTHIWSQASWNKLTADNIVIGVD